MPEITLHNITPQLQRHEPFLAAMLRATEKSAIRVECEGIKSTSLGVTIRQIIGVLLRNNGAGLIPPVMMRSIEQTWRTHRLRSNETLIQDNILLFSPHVFEEIIKLRYVGSSGYMPTFSVEKVKPTRIKFIPVSEDGEALLGSLARQERDSPTIKDATPVGSAPYSDEVFLAFCLLKDKGLINEPVSLFNPPPFTVLPPHSQFQNLAVIEDGENLLIL